MPDDRPSKGDSIIFIDVESLPAEPDNPLWLQLAPTIGLPEGVLSETPEEKEIRVERLRLSTALHGSLGHAWMIGLAEGGGDPLILQSDGTYGAEKDLLEQLWDSVKDKRNPWWVGHNIEGYDFPFLKVRALHHGLGGLARKIGGPHLQKPWEKRIIDTQKVWPRTGADRFAWRKGLPGLAKLDTICHMLGIEQQEGVMGADVYQAFLDGNHEGVASHLDYDIRQVREVFRRLYEIL